MPVPNPIPHKTLYISGYICSCYAFVFIFEFPEHISKHILQFHTFFLSVTHRSRSRYGTNLIFMKQKAFAWGFIFFFVVTFIALWGDDGFSSIDIWGFVLVCIPCGFVGFLGGAIAMVMVKNKRKEDEE